MTPLTLADLRVFCAVAETLSVTQAAQLLYRTQPAVSRQIAEMEKDLGVSLFFRRGRRLELTPAGEELLGRSQALLEDAGDLTKRAQQLATGNTSVLRIGAMASALESFFPSLLLAFAREWPNVTIRVVEADAPELVHLLETGQLDLALTRDYMTSPTLATTRLFPMSLIAVVAASHRLAGKETLGVQDLEREPLLLMHPGSASRVLLSRACQAEGLTLRDIRMESRTTNALVTLAEGGFGIAVAMSTLLSHPPKARVMPVHLRGEHLGIWYSAIWLRRRTVSIHVDAFVKAARQRMKEHFPGEGYAFPGLP
ncbi:LysR family transcriptional regulator [Hydrogenophaga sp. 2FB]|uniref:LysR family transcriptional regulator n=1 Tax=Hydrogenophaga sp. 2FB TaxID=2502187 RepID=UPI0010F78DEB|nr:LysR family transcriptional regulator [Hydrogenophaga sp. 2FB]